MGRRRTALFFRTLQETGSGCTTANQIFILLLCAGCWIQHLACCLLEMGRIWISLLAQLGSNASWHVWVIVTTVSKKNRWENKMCKLNFFPENIVLHFKSSYYSLCLHSFICNYPFRTIFEDKIRLFCWILSVWQKCCHYNLSWMIFSG